MAPILWETVYLYASPEDNASTGGEGSSLPMEYRLKRSGLHRPPDSMKCTQWWRIMRAASEYLRCKRSPFADLQAPFTLLNPVDGSSLTEVSSIRLEATASDPDGSIAQVEFYVNGERNATVDYNASFLQPNFAYGTTWSPDANGSYRIYAVALDNGGNRVISDVVTITVVPGSDAPVAQMNSISSVERYPRDEIYFNLTSFSDDGQITEVAFYVNGQLFTSLTDLPYEMVWEPFLPGRYQIYQWSKIIRETLPLLMFRQ